MFQASVPINIEGLGESNLSARTKDRSLMKLLIVQMHQYCLQNQSRTQVSYIVIKLYCHVGLLTKHARRLSKNRRKSIVFSLAQLSPLGLTAHDSSPRTKTVPSYAIFLPSYFFEQKHKFIIQFQYKRGLVTYHQHSFALQ